MIVVFWLEHHLAVESPAEAAPHCRRFAPNELNAALRCAEELRARRAAGDPISHVTIQSELPQAVGEPGVADPPKDYAHYKRRIDPSIPLGRPRVP